MENATQSSRPEARIIHLRIPEIPFSSRQQEPYQTTISELQTLEYIDQLLDEHFK